MKLKLLLYCKIDRPYLYHKEEYWHDTMNRIDLGYELENYVDSELKKEYESNSLNGKIVLECDYEISKLFPIHETIDDYDYGAYLNDSFIPVSQDACLSTQEIYDYLANNKESNDKLDSQGFAILVKNLKLIEPRELESTCYYDPKNNYKMIEKDYKKNHRYMRVICLGEALNPEFVFFPVTSNELYKILIGEKTIIIRKKVIKEMIFTL